MSRTERRVQPREEPAERRRRARRRRATASQRPDGSDREAMRRIPGGVDGSGGGLGYCGRRRHRPAAGCEPIRTRFPLADRDDRRLYRRPQHGTMTRTTAAGAGDRPRAWGTPGRRHPRSPVRGTGPARTAGPWGDVAWRRRRTRSSGGCSGTSRSPGGWGTRRPGCWSSGWWTGPNCWPTPPATTPTPGYCVGRLCRRGKAIGRFVQLWADPPDPRVGGPTGRRRAVRLAAADRPRRPARPDAPHPHLGEPAPGGVGLGRRSGRASRQPGPRLERLPSRSRLGRSRRPPETEFWPIVPAIGGLDRQYGPAVSSVNRGKCARRATVATGRIGGKPEVRIQSAAGPIP